MSKNSLENFLEAIISNPEIQQQISQAKNVEEFIEIIYAIAQNKGYNFTLEELKTQMVGGNDQISASDHLSIRHFIKNLRWARGKNDDLWHKLKKLT